MGDFKMYLKGISLLMLLSMVQCMPVSSSKCHPECGNLFWWMAGICQESGICLCKWGWTGPDASYINDLEYRNRIQATFCNEPCHYTHDYRNPRCAEIIYEEINATNSKNVSESAKENKNEGETFSSVSTQSIYTQSSSAILLNGTNASKTGSILKTETLFSRGVPSISNKSPIDITKKLTTNGMLSTLKPGFKTASTSTQNIQSNIENVMNKDSSFKILTSEKTIQSTFNTTTSTNEILTSSSGKTIDMSTKSSSVSTTTISTRTTKAPPITQETDPDEFLNTNSLTMSNNFTSTPSKIMTASTIVTKTSETSETRKVENRTAKVPNATQTVIKSNGVPATSMKKDINTKATDSSKISSAMTVPSISKLQNTATSKIISTKQLSSSNGDIFGTTLSPSSKGSPSVTIENGKTNSFSNTNSMKEETQTDGAKISSTLKPSLSKSSASITESSKKVSVVKKLVETSSFSTESFKNFTASVDDGETNFMAATSISSSSENAKLSSTISDNINRGATSQINPQSSILPSMSANKDGTKNIISVTTPSSVSISTIKTQLTDVGNSQPTKTSFISTSLYTAPSNKVLTKEILKTVEDNSSFTPKSSIKEGNRISNTLKETFESISTSKDTAQSTISDSDLPALNTVSVSTKSPIENIVTSNPDATSSKTLPLSSTETQVETTVINSSKRSEIINKSAAITDEASTNVTPAIKMTETVAATKDITKNLKTKSPSISKNTSNPTKVFATKTRISDKDSMNSNPTSSFSTKISAAEEIEKEQKATFTSAVQSSSKPAQVSTQSVPITDEASASTITVTKDVTKDQNKKFSSMSKSFSNAIKLSTTSTQIPDEDSASITRSIRISTQSTTTEEIKKDQNTGFESTIKPTKESIESTPVIDEASPSATATVKLSPKASQNTDKKVIKSVPSRKADLSSTSTPSFTIREQVKSELTATALVSTDDKRTIPEITSSISGITPTVILTSKEVKIDKDIMESSTKSTILNKESEKRKVDKTAFVTASPSSKSLLSGEISTTKLNEIDEVSLVNTLSTSIKPSLNEVSTKQRIVANTVSTPLISDSIRRDLSFSTTANSVDVSFEKAVPPNTKSLKQTSNEIASFNKVKTTTTQNMSNPSNTVNLLSSRTLETDEVYFPTTKSKVNSKTDDIKLTDTISLETASAKQTIIPKFSLATKAASNIMKTTIQGSIEVIKSQSSSFRSSTIEKVSSSASPVVLDIITTKSPSIQTSAQEIITTKMDKISLATTQPTSETKLASKNKNLSKKTSSSTTFKMDSSSENSRKDMRSTKVMVLSSSSTGYPSTNMAKAKEILSTTISSNLRTNLDKLKSTLKNNLETVSRPTVSKSKKSTETVMVTSPPNTTQMERGTSKNFNSLKSSVIKSSILPSATGVGNEIMTSTSPSTSITDLETKQKEDFDKVSSTTMPVRSKLSTSKIIPESVLPSTDETSTSLLASATFNVKTSNTNTVKDRKASTIMDISSTSRKSTETNISSNKTATLIVVPSKEPANQTPLLSSISKPSITDQVLTKEKISINTKKLSETIVASKNNTLATISPSSTFKVETSSMEKGKDIQSKSTMMGSPISTKAFMTKVPPGEKGSATVVPDKTSTKQISSLVPTSSNSKPSISKDKVLTTEKISINSKKFSETIVASKNDTLATVSPSTTFKVETSRMEKGKDIQPTRTMMGSSISTKAFMTNVPPAEKGSTVVVPDKTLTKQVSSLVPTSSNTKQSVSKEISAADKTLTRTEKLTATLLGSTKNTLVTTSTSATSKVKQSNTNKAKDENPTTMNSLSTKVLKTGISLVTKRLATTSKAATEKTLTPSSSVFPTKEISNIETTMKISASTSPLTKKVSPTSKKLLKTAISSTAATNEIPNISEDSKKSKSTPSLSNSLSSTKVSLTRKIEEKSKAPSSTISITKTLRPDEEKTTLKSTSSFSKSRKSTIVFSSPAVTTVESFTATVSSFTTSSKQPMETGDSGSSITLATSTSQPSASATMIKRTKSTRTKIQTASSTSKTNTSSTVSTVSVTQPSPTTKTSTTKVPPTTKPVSSTKLKTRTTTTTKPTTEYVRVFNEIS